MDCKTKLEAVKTSSFCKPRLAGIQHVIIVKEDRDPLFWLRQPFGVFLS